jgi:hypothetical protein
MRFALLALSIPLLGAAAEIPRGSHVALKMVNSVSTRTAKNGDYVYMTTATPIAAGGQIVVPVGSYVQGVVTRSVRSGRVKGRAELSMRIDTLTLPSGTVVKVSPHLSAVDSGEVGQKVGPSENEVKQSGEHGADAVTVARTAGAGAAIGGIADRSWTGAGIGAGAGSAVGLAWVLLTRGHEVELRSGSTVDVVFDRAVPIE